MHRVQYLGKRADAKKDTGAGRCDSQSVNGDSLVKLRFARVKGLLTHADIHRHTQTIS